MLTSLKIRYLSHSLTHALAKLQLHPILVGSGALAAEKYNLTTSSPNPYGAITMRLSILALAALLGSSNAFAPAHFSTQQQRSSQHVVTNLSSNNNHNNNQENIIEDAKNVVLGTFTAATLLMGTMVPLPANAGLAAPGSELANKPLEVKEVTKKSAPIKAEATKATTTEVVKKKTTSTPAPEKKAAVPAPLSTEKAALESAKSAYTTAMKPLSDAKSQVSSASSAYTKATSARESAQKKSTDLKKKLSNANDSLAKAKKNGKPSQITDVYVKEIANIKVCFVYI